MMESVLSNNKVDTPKIHWKRILARSRVSAHFQPIVAADTGRVFGHEALGRYQAFDGAGQASSLGPFFLGERSGSLKRDVDRAVREDAVAKAAAAGGDSRLFINIAPSLILGHLARGGMPHSVRLVRKYGLDPRRVVLEITEENVDVDAEDLLRIIHVYREEGFAIALDDVGSASSNLDRVGLCRPDIIKIDFRLLERSAESESFRYILDALARLAERIGSDLLFEGIETEAHLGSALSYGGRYLQGYLFSPALPGFSAPESFSEMLGIRVERYYRERSEQVRIERRTVDGLAAFAGSLRIGPETIDADLRRIAAGDAARVSRILRVYATDATGRQITPNFSFGLGGIGTDEGARGRRWTYRPYFFEHVERSYERPGQWTVSAPYRDIALRRPVRTLARTDAESGSIVFVDVEA